MLCSGVPPSYLDSSWERLNIQGLAPFPPVYLYFLFDLDVDVPGQISFEDWVLLLKKHLDATIWSHFKEGEIQRAGEGQ